MTEYRPSIAYRSIIYINVDLYVGETYATSKVWIKEVIVHASQNYLKLKPIEAVCNTNYTLLIPNHEPYTL